MTSQQWVRRRAQELIAEHLGPDWSFDFDHARTRFGSCRHQSRQITCSRYLIAYLSDDQTDQLLRHEIAHGLAGAEAHHGPAWLKQARRIGYLGGRTMTVPEVRQQAPWYARCPCGLEYYRYRRPAGRSRCGRCGRQGINHYLHWVDRREIVAKKPPR